VFPNGGIAVDHNGFVYVLDQNNNRIQKFDSNGTFVNKWDLSGGVADVPVTGIPIEKSGVAVGSGGAIYTTFGNDRIQIFSQ
jgi:DNA-binding beta-propeller fold protein YncE